MALSGKSAVSKPVSHSYVLMVQHLIEKCLIMYMDLDDCCKSLAKYARVKPAVTVAVWRGLEKENAEFFRQYLLKRTENRAKAFDQALEEATAKFCNQTLRADLHINGCGQSKVRQAVKSCPIGAPLRSSIAVHSG
jgi:uncharacterized protein (TIGR01589 family)